MEFRLLGPVQAIVAGRPLALGERKQRLVLAILLLEANRVVPIDRMVDLIWQDGPPDTARRILQAHVSRLRGILSHADGVSLVRHGVGYLLACDSQRIDVHEFRLLLEQARHTADDTTKTALLRQALNLWRGPALADVTTAMLRQELFASLEEARLCAVKERIDAELRLGRHLDLIDELTELKAKYPGRQAFAGQLMLALYRAGRLSDALGVYRHTRKRLRDELGLDPSAELTQLQVAILRSDPALDLTPATVDTTPAEAAQIPRDIPDFVGRCGALTQLDRLSATADEAVEGATPVALITGAPGVGKTALALRWAHRAKERFTGQLYVNLRAHSGPPMEPLTALTVLLGGLGMGPGRVPSTVDEASGLYRSLLSRRRVLVILDDAASAAQVRPLLPGGPGCMVVVTSRSRLVGLTAADGAVPVRLTPLHPAESVDLLHTLLGSPSTTLSELASVCEGLPLALRIAATNALHGHGPVDRYVKELAAGSLLDGLEVAGDPQHGLRSVLAASYVNLAAPARRLLRLLSSSHGPWTLDGIAALSGLSEEMARRVLGTLVDVHLVELSPTGYALTSLVQAFAAERAAEDSGAIPMPSLA